MHEALPSNPQQPKNNNKTITMMMMKAETIKLHRYSISIKHNTIKLLEDTTEENTSDLDLVIRIISHIKGKS